MKNTWKPVSLVLFLSILLFACIDQPVGLPLPEPDQGITFRTPEQRAGEIFGDPRYKWLVDNQIWINAMTLDYLENTDSTEAVRVKDIFSQWGDTTYQYTYADQALMADVFAFANEVDLVNYLQVFAGHLDTLFRLFPELLPVNHAQHEDLVGIVGDHFLDHAFGEEENPGTDTASRRDCCGVPCPENERCFEETCRDFRDCRRSAVITGFGIWGGAIQIGGGIGTLVGGLPGGGVGAAVGTLYGAIGGSIYLLWEYNENCPADMFRNCRYCERQFPCE